MLIKRLDGVPYQLDEGIFIHHLPRAICAAGGVFQRSFPSTSISPRFARSPHDISFVPWACES